MFEMAIQMEQIFLFQIKVKKNPYMAIFSFLYEIKNLPCESPFQILLTNLYSNSKDFFMHKLPKVRSDIVIFIIQATKTQQNERYYYYSPENIGGGK